MTDAIDVYKGSIDEAAGAYPMAPLTFSAEGEAPAGYVNAGEKQADAPAPEPLATLEA